MSLGISLRTEKAVCTWGIVVIYQACALSKHRTEYFMFQCNPYNCSLREMTTFITILQIRKPGLRWYRTRDQGIQTHISLMPSKLRLFKKCSRGFWLNEKPLNRGPDDLACLYPSWHWNGHRLQVQGEAETPVRRSQDLHLIFWKTFSLDLEANVRVGRIYQAVLPVLISSIQSPSQLQMKNREGVLPPKRGLENRECSVLAYDSEHEF